MDDLRRANGDYKEKLEYAEEAFCAEITRLNQVL